jgi:hypothetical protein
MDGGVCMILNLRQMDECKRECREKYRKKILFLSRDVLQMRGSLPFIGKEKAPFTKSQQ